MTGTMHAPARTQIARGTRISAPVRRLCERHVDLIQGQRVLHHGEGKAQADTAMLRRYASSVTPYDPFSPDPDTRDPSRLLQAYDVAVSNYVMNVLPLRERVLAYAELLQAAPVLLISVRSDHVNGTPYDDGVMTSRGTFQHTFTVDEVLHAFRPMRGEVTILHADATSIQFQVVRYNPLTLVVQ